MSNGEFPLKPHLSAAEQLAQLKRRGLAVADDEAALRDIARLGYYRLSGYYYPLRLTNPMGIAGRQDGFVEGASLDLVVQVADFDKRLRLLALDAIESVEVSLRVAIAHRLGKIDSMAHYRPDLLDSKFTTVSKFGVDAPYAEWLRRFEAACASSKEEFCKHHIQHYGGKMPIWVAIELWDFGMLSRFYEGLQKRDRDALAREFAPVDGPVLVNWLKMLNFVRNAAAHHSRLWNRTLPDEAKLPLLEHCRLLKPLHDTPASRRKLFAAFTCLRLLLRKLHPESTWHERVKTHLATFPDTPLLTIASAGFERAWQDAAIWQ